MTSYIQNILNFPPKTDKLIDKFSKVARHKINI